MYAIIDEQIERRMHGRTAGEPRKNDLLDVMLEEGESKEDSNEINRDAIRGLFTVSTCTTCGRILICE